MEAELRGHLVALARAYAAAKGLEMSTVARLATGDWRFFERVGSGASFTARKYDVIVQWFSENWPEGVDQPVAPSRASDPEQGEAAA